MLLATSSPPSETASKRICSEKPSAAPMITCWMVIRTPAAENGVTSGTVTRGATSSATAPARMTRTRMGTVTAPNAGASMKHEPIRTNGQKSSASQPSNCCAVRAIMTSDAFSIDEPGDAHDELPRVAHQRLQHPGAGEGEGERDRDQLRNEGERHLVDGGGGLERADDDTGEERGQQERRGQGKRHLEGAAADGHDGIGCHGCGSDQ